MAGISIGSSFQLTSPQPHLANASFPDAPTRLAQGQLRHVSWRYSQDNPDAHYRIKPLAVCFLADGITPAVQFDSWGTLEAHWRIMPVTSDDLPESATPSNKYYTSARAALKADLVNGLVPAAQLPPYPAATAPVQATNTSLGTVRGGGTGNVNINTDGSQSAPVAPLYGTPGTATDGPMTQAATTAVTGLPPNLLTSDKSSLTAAINEVKNAQGKSAVASIAGVLTSFPTYELAEAATAVGSDITLTGYHAAISVDKSVNISGGTVGAAVIGYVSAGITARLHGISALGRFVVCQAGTGTITVEFSDLTTGPAFWLESYGYLPAPAGGPGGTAVVNVVNCRARNISAYIPQTNAISASGNLRFQERNNSSRWTFRNCDLRNDFGPNFSGYPATATRVVLEAATVLTPGVGKPTQETSVLSSNVLTTDANFYQDNRTGPATATTLGAVKIGTGISVTADGTISSAGARKVFSKGTNSVNAALVASVYTLIPFDTIVNNIGGGLVGTAFTAPATDVYAVVVSLRFADGSTPTPVKNVFIGLSSGAATSITDGRWRDTMSNRSTVDCYLEVMLTVGQTYSGVYFLDGFAASAGTMVSFRALNVI